MESVNVIASYHLQSNISIAYIVYKHSAGTLWNKDDGKKRISLNVSYLI